MDEDKGIAAGDGAGIDDMDVDPADIDDLADGRIFAFGAPGSSMVEHAAPASASVATAADFATIPVVPAVDVAVISLLLG